MLNFKKTALAVLALGSSAVFAGTMGPVCVPGNVTVPCENTAWSFGAQALYLKAASSGSYAWASKNTAGGIVGTSGVLNTNYNDVDPSWGWGFQVEGAYEFSTGNDLNLNWYHYKRLTNNTFLGNNTIAGPIYSGIATPAIGTEASLLSYDPQWDAVNLEFGQLAHFGAMSDMRFHGGVQYARIKSELVTLGTLPGFVGTAAQVNQSAELDSTFNGFGPRIGFDMPYNFGNGFAVYANGATSLLIGKGKFNSSSTNVTGTVLPTIATTNVGGSTTMFVPELEGKLGATYDYAMSQGNLSLNAGWMWVEYFDSQIYSVASGVVTPTEANLGLNGPFVGLKWVGNV